MRLIVQKSFRHFTPGSVIERDPGVAAVLLKRGLVRKEEAVADAKGTTTPTRNRNNKRKRGRNGKTSAD